MDKPYLLFLGDARDQLAAKGSRGVFDWRPDDCLGQIRLAGCKADLGIADMTIAEAAGAGAKTMIVGVANAGGFIPDNWIDTVTAALDAGMDVAAGMHTRLADIEAIAKAATRNGRQLFDVRHPTRDFAVGKGTKRSGKRLLAVGTGIGLVIGQNALMRRTLLSGREAAVVVAGGLAAGLASGLLCVTTGLLGAPRATVFVLGGATLGEQLLTLRLARL